MTDHPIRVGVIGCGRMGGERARAAKSLGATIAVVCDLDVARAQAFASLYPGSRVVSLDKLELSELQALFVCLPPVSRGPVELAALSAGVPVLAEKPVGLQASQIAPVLERLKS